MSTCPAWCPGHSPDLQPWHRPTPDGDLERLHAYYRPPVEGVPIRAGVLAVETRDGIGPGGVVLDLSAVTSPDRIVRLTSRQAATFAGQLMALTQHAAKYGGERARSDR
jgi:hypothetical protein